MLALDELCKQLHDSTQDVMSVQNLVHNRLTAKTKDQDSGSMRCSDNGWPSSKSEQAKIDWAKVRNYEGYTSTCHCKAIKALLVQYQARYKSMVCICTLAAYLPSHSQVHFGTWMYSSTRARISSSNVKLIKRSDAVTLRSLVCWRKHACYGWREIWWIVPRCVYICRKDFDEPYQPVCKDLTLRTVMLLLPNRIQ